MSMLRSFSGGDLADLGSSFGLATAGLGAPFSPDAIPGVSLTVYDLDASQIYARALTLSRTLFPDWNAVAGNTETVLLQAFATEAAEQVYAINRLPGAILQALLSLAGIPRSPGLQASASVSFTCADTLGHTIPAGTVLQMAGQAGSGYTFTTDANLAISAGASVGVMTATCTAYSSAPNQTPAGTVLLPAGFSTPWLSSVVLASAVSGGMDPETIPAWLQRGTQGLQSLSSTLVTPFQFQQKTLSNPAVWRCTVTNNWDATAASTTYGASATGHLTVSVLGKGNTDISGANITSLSSSLTSMAQANLAIHVVAPTVTTVNVVVNCQRLPGWADSDVVTSVQDAIANYLSTDTWPWEGTVHLTKVLQVVEDAPGVDFATTITLNGGVGDVALPGIANLAEAGTVTVNVVDPSSPTSYITSVNVSATVYQTGSTDATVKAAVQSAINSYLTTAIAAGLVRYSSLIVKIAEVANVTDVQGVTINGFASDLSVTPSATQTGTITVSMGN